MSMHRLDVLYQRKRKRLNNTTSLGHRIRKIRGEVSQGQFATEIGVHKNTLGAYERDIRVPDSSVLAIICDKYEINPSWLLFGEEPMRRMESMYGMDKSAHSVPSYNWMQLSEGSESYASDIFIPKRDNLDAQYYDYVPMVEAHLENGNGSFRFLLSDVIKDFAAFRKEWLRKISSSPNAVVLMKINGTNMEPTFCDGDVVMIDLGRKRIHDGYYYAINQGQNVSIKRLEMVSEEQVRIFNDSHYGNGPQEVPVSQLKILGRVIWFSREFVKGEG